jgi:hypothetical protein
MPPLPGAWARPRGRCRAPCLSPGTHTNEAAHPQSAPLCPAGRHRRVTRGTHRRGAAASSPSVAGERWVRNRARRSCASATRSSSRVAEDGRLVRSAPPTHCTTAAAAGSSTAPPPLGSSISSSLPTPPSVARDDNTTPAAAAPATAVAVGRRRGRERGPQAATPATRARTLPLVLSSGILRPVTAGPGLPAMLPCQPALT